MQTKAVAYVAIVFMLNLSSFLGNSKSSKKDPEITTLDPDLTTTQIDYEVETTTHDGEQTTQHDEELTTSPNDSDTTGGLSISRTGTVNRLEHLRRPIRALIIRACEEAAEELAKEEPDVVELHVLLEKLNDLWNNIIDVNQKIMDMLVDADTGDEEMDKEANSVQEYNDMVRRTRVKISMMLSLTDGHYINGTSKRMKKTYQLPKIEIKKFNGELTEWLSFWSQFQKIDEDEDLHDSDKLQYLVQSMIPGTKGSDLVNRYPQTGHNYPKVISALKERFGNKKLLGDVYARELLKMTLHGASSKNKSSLSTLYDKLETNLHALESIDIAAEGPHILLLPMVESSLPEEVLRAWQRSPLSSEDGSTQTPIKTSLDFLMDFLRKEVRNEERIELANKGFQLAKEKRKVKSPAVLSIINQQSSNKRHTNTVENRLRLNKTETT